MWSWAVHIGVDWEKEQKQDLSSCTLQDVSIVFFYCSFLPFDINLRQYVVFQGYHGK